MPSSDFPIGVARNNPLVRPVFTGDPGDQPFGPGTSTFILTESGNEILTESGDELLTET